MNGHTDSCRRRFLESAARLPAPGGNGYHSALMSTANYAALALMPRDEAFQAIRLSTPAGSRPVPNSEIHDALSKAYSGRGSGQRASVSESLTDNMVSELLPFILDRGKDASETAIRASSPVTIPDDPSGHGSLLLQNLPYENGDFIYLGTGRESRHDQSSAVRPFSEQLQLLQHSGSNVPHFMPNPLTGNLCPSGSLRSDEAVRRYTMAVAEMDRLPRALFAPRVRELMADTRSLEQPPCPFIWQLRILAGLKLPTYALIYTGGKSIHSLVRVDSCDSFAEWRLLVRDRLFARFLKPLGFDPACSNPSRMSRLPGFLRPDTNRPSRLLYLDPKGGNLCSH